MSDFKGFDSREKFVPLPESFFSQLLAGFTDIASLKAALYALWQLMLRSEEPVLPWQALLAETAQEVTSLSAADLERGLQAAIDANLLLLVETPSGTFVLLNSPRGRLLENRIREGWQPPAASPQAPRPGIYQLYESNIGPLTPLLADALRDAEAAYGPEWVAEAIRIAAERNVRNWRYIQGILKRWKEEGYDRENRQDAEETANRYRRGKYADFID